MFINTEIVPSSSGSYVFPEISIKGDSPSKGGVQADVAKKSALLGVTFQLKSMSGAAGYVALGLVGGAVIATGVGAPAGAYLESAAIAGYIASGSGIAAGVLSNDYSGAFGLFTIASFSYGVGQLAGGSIQNEMLNTWASSLLEAALGR